MCAGSAGSAELPFMQHITSKRQISTLVIAGAPFLVVLGAVGRLLVRPLRFATETLNCKV